MTICETLVSIWIVYHFARLMVPVIEASDRVREEYYHA